MSNPARQSDARFESLELPPEFDDLSGLIQSDLRAIVSVLIDRADQRLLLTRRERLVLKRRLWNGLTGVVNKALEPLTAECR